MYGIRELNGSSEPDDFWQSLSRIRTVRRGNCLNRECCVCGRVLEDVSRLGWKKTPPHLACRADKQEVVEDEYERDHEPNFTSSNEASVYAAMAEVESLLNEH